MILLLKYKSTEDCIEVEGIANIVWFCTKLNIISLKFQFNSSKNSGQFTFILGYLFYENLNANSNLNYQSKGIFNKLYLEESREIECLYIYKPTYFTKKKLS